MNKIIKSILYFLGSLISPFQRAFQSYKTQIINKLLGEVIAGVITLI